MCLAIPGKVISIDTIQSGTFRTGKVSFGGIIKEVNLSMVPDALVDDYVLVHVGVAISKVDEAEALITLDYFRQIGELNELEPYEDESTPKEKE